MVAGIVIVGAGHAGVELAASLRAEGYEGALTMLSAEPDLPYQRPPLSKAFLKGSQAVPQLLRPDSFYAKRAIELRLGAQAVALDRRARKVRLADGGEVPFDRLALTTGARVLRPPVEGIGLDGVLYLRAAEDARTLRERVASASTVVVVGGGFIGLEVAATLAALGKAVTVLEASDRLLGRSVAPVVSRYVLARHRGWQIDVRLNTPLGRILGEQGRVRAVETAQGARIEADLVVIGIGVAPETGLAAGAGLDCANGICVDGGMATSEPAVVAAGDSAAFVPWSGSRRLRLESVQNAVDQAKTAARSLLGQPSTYLAVPWFWSDQGDIKLQMVGLGQGGDRLVVRGAPESDRFSVFRYEGDRLLAIDSINRPGDHLLGRRFLATGFSPDPEAVADESVDLKALFMAATGEQ
jgi:3-phenylpropionate/trans-cinnamate dioxygenase ferredoxin reductase subunit